HYMSAAEPLAATHTPALMMQMPSCQGGNVDDVAGETDAGALGRGFCRRSYRRPLADEEVAADLEVFRQGTLLGDEGYSPSTGIEMVVQMMLQSPHFLYRVEFGMPDPVADDVVPLTSYEIASRLSYLLWNTMPDTTLFEA